MGGRARGPITRGEVRPAWRPRVRRLGVLRREVACGGAAAHLHGQIAAGRDGNTRQALPRRAVPTSPCLPLVSSCPSCPRVLRPSLSCPGADLPVLPSRVLVPLVSSRVSRSALVPCAPAQPSPPPSQLQLISSPCLVPLSHACSCLLRAAQAWSGAECRVPSWVPGYNIHVSTIHRSIRICKTGGAFWPAWCSLHPISTEQGTRPVWRTETALTVTDPNGMGLLARSPGTTRPSCPATIRSSRAPASSCASRASSQPALCLPSRARWPDVARTAPPLPLPLPATSRGCASVGS